MDILRKDMSYHVGIRTQDRPASRLVTILTTLLWLPYSTLTLCILAN